MQPLIENQYSEGFDINYLDDPNIKKLVQEENGRDSILKFQIMSKSKFRFKVHNHCGHIKIGNESYFVIPKMGEKFLETMLKAFNNPFFKSYSSDLLYLEI